MLRRTWQVPVIGWQPLQSLEQLGPLAIFFVLQLLAVADIGRALLSLGPEAHQRLQMMMLGMGAAAVAMLLSAAMEAGYLGPVSARVRGLFIKHTKTGNPLVDSVAEHQATPTRAYWRYFHVVMYLAPVGLFSLVMSSKKPGVKRTDAEWFLGLYCFVSWYFSQKMIRLVLLLGPAAACVGGHALCVIVGWSLKKIMAGSGGDEEQQQQQRAAAAARAERANARRVAELEGDERRVRELDRIDAEEEELPPEMQWGGAVLLLLLTVLGGQAYLYHCRRMAEALSEPQIMTRIRDPDVNPTPCKCFAAGSNPTSVGLFRAARSRSWMTTGWRTDSCGRRPLTTRGSWRGGTMATRSLAWATAPQSPTGCAHEPLLLSLAAFLSCA